MHRLLKERERVHKIFFGLIIAVAVLLFAAFNVWTFQWAKSGKAPSPEALLQTIIPPRQSFQRLNPATQGLTLPDPNSPPVIPNSPPVIPASPTPTPRPTGPGEYACDPYGVCNRYENAARKEFCTVTFADRFCLDQCGEKEKQCKK